MKKKVRFGRTGWSPTVNVTSSPDASTPHSSPHLLVNENERNSLKEASGWVTRVDELKSLDTLVTSNDRALPHQQPPASA
jgi:hypothetical protein